MTTKQKLAVILFMHGSVVATCMFGMWLEHHRSQPTRAMPWIKSDSTTQPSPGHLYLIRFIGPEIFLAHHNGKDFVDPVGTPLRPLEWKPLIPHPYDHIHQLELNHAISWAWDELSRLARKTKEE